MADGEPAIQTLMTAVKLARQEGTVVTGKPRYDSKSKGLGGESSPVGAGIAAHLGGVDGETVPNDAESAFNSCAMECTALWLESHSMHHPGRWRDTVQKTAMTWIRRCDR